MVLTHALLLGTIGMAIGLSLGSAAGRLLVSFLFGVSPIDPVAFGGAAAVFVAVVLGASYVPARRATRIDPIAALRCE